MRDGTPYDLLPEGKGGCFSVTHQGSQPVCSDAGLDRVLLREHDLPHPGDFAGHPTRGDLVASRKRLDRSREWDPAGRHPPHPARQQDAVARSRNRSRSLGPVIPFDFTCTTRHTAAKFDHEPLAIHRGISSGEFGKFPAAFDRSPLTGAGIAEYKHDAGLTKMSDGRASRRSRTPGPPGMIGGDFRGLECGSQERAGIRVKEVGTEARTGSLDCRFIAKADNMKEGCHTSSYGRRTHHFPVGGPECPETARKRHLTRPPSLTAESATTWNLRPHHRTPIDPESDVQGRCPWDISFDNYGGRSTDAWRPWRRRLRTQSPRPGDTFSGVGHKFGNDWSEFQEVVGLSPGRGQRFNASPRHGAVRHSSLTGSGLDWAILDDGPRKGKAQTPRRHHCTSLTGGGNVVHAVQDVPSGRGTRGQASPSIRPKDSLSIGSLMPG